MKHLHILFLLAPLLLVACSGSGGGSGNGNNNLVSTADVDGNGNCTPSFVNDSRAVRDSFKEYTRSRKDHSPEKDVIEKYRILKKSCDGFFTVHSAAAICTTTSPENVAVQIRGADIQTICQEAAPAHAGFQPAEQLPETLPADADGNCRSFYVKDFNSMAASLAGASESLTEQRRLQAECKTFYTQYPDKISCWQTAEGKSRRFTNSTDMKSSCDGVETWLKKNDTIRR